MIGPGKMGAAVAEVARARGDEVVASIGSREPVNPSTLRGAHVAIEFTCAQAAVGNIRACVAAGVPVVVGTTGWHDRLDEVSRFVVEKYGAILWSSNFSIGVHLLSRLVRVAGELTRELPGFEPHLVETHHSAKRDAPSGTALQLRREFETASGRDLPITSVRLGSVPGTHELVIDGAFEQLVIAHEARDRRVFAEGALLAARWLVGRRGIFTFSDVLDAHGGID